MESTGMPLPHSHEVARPIGIKNLPAFPSFVKNVHLLHRRINADSADELKKKQERLQGVEIQRKIIEEATHVTLPPLKESATEVGDRYDSHVRWKNFVLHDIYDDNYWNVAHSRHGISRKRSSI